MFFLGINQSLLSLDFSYFGILYVLQLEVSGDMYLKISLINVRIFYIEKNFIGLNIYLGRGKN